MFTLRSSTAENVHTYELTDEFIQRFKQRYDKATNASNVEENKHDKKQANQVLFGLIGIAGSASIAAATEGNFSNYLCAATAIVSGYLFTAGFINRNAVKNKYEQAPLFEGRTPEWCIEQRKAEFRFLCNHKLDNEKILEPRQQDVTDSRIAIRNIETVVAEAVEVGKPQYISRGQAKRILNNEGKLSIHDYPSTKKDFVIRKYPKFT